MQTIEIGKGIRVAFEDLLRSIQKMDSSTLEQLAGEVNRLVAQPRSKKEDDIIAQIKELVPASLRRRYQELHGKMQSENITEREQEEFLQITDFMEKKMVERVHLLAEIAALRDTSLTELMKQPDMKFLGHAEALFPTK